MRQADADAPPAASCSPCPATNAALAPITCLPAGAGIEVTLLWHRTSGELTVSVTDAYAGAQGVAY